MMAVVRATDTRRLPVVGLAVPRFPIAELPVHFRSVFWASWGLCFAGLSVGGVDRRTECQASDILAIATNLGVFWA